MNSLLNLATISILSASPISIAEKVDPKVTVLSSLSEIQLETISKEDAENTLFFWDIDDTVFDSKTMLGSSEWRRQIRSMTKNIPVDKKLGQNWHDIFSYDLAQYHPLNTVEKTTACYIKTLQNSHYVVAGLTARERKKWYATEDREVDDLTIKQLASVDVNFDNNQLEKSFPQFVENPRYYKGVFFSDTDLKGELLIQLFKDKHPKKVFFIDDKDTQTESVAKALADLGISHECYTYTATKAKSSEFDPLVANIQLWYFYNSGGKYLTDEEAREIAANTTHDASYYLNLSIELAPSFKRFK